MARCRVPGGWHPNPELGSPPSRGDYVRRAAHGSTVPHPDHATDWRRGRRRRGVFFTVAIEMAADRAIVECHSGGALEKFKRPTSRRASYGRPDSCAPDSFSPRRTAPRRGSSRWRAC